MLKNYIIIAFRQFTRHKMFSALNIFCLATGISFCLLIGQYVLHETAINSNLQDPHQQFFLNSSWKIKNTGPEITTVGPLAKALKTNYPALVENYFRFNPVVNVVSAGDKHFREDVSICDTTFVSMYGFPLIYGNPGHAFAGARSAVITESFAMKLFGEKNVINKTITFTNLSGKTTDYTVSAVLKDAPYTTVTHAFSNHGYAMYIPFEGNKYYPTGTGEDNWNGFYIVGFVKLKPGIKPEQLAAPTQQLLKANSQETINKNLRVEFKSLDTFYLKADNGIVEKTLSILALVALSILLLAVINFVNIMIGTSSYRIREIGLRKVFGGRRKELVLQYLVESIVLTLFAALLSIFFYGMFRPLFNAMLNTNLAPVTMFHLREIIYLVILALTVGILAGFYPALILSGSAVVNSVKGKLSSIEKGAWMRKSLLVLQFSIAIGVIIFSLTLSKQVNYFFDKDLGYDKDKLVVITAFPKQWDSAGVARMELIRDALVSSRLVKDATVSFDIPERTTTSQLQVNADGAKNNQVINVGAITVDGKFADTYGIHLLEGRFFDDQTGVFTSGEAVINESALKSFGWKDIFGKKFTIPDGGGPVNVVGVIKDFHIGSLHESIKPLVFFHVKDNNTYRFLTVKLNAGNISSSINRVRDKWKELSPSAPFEFSFMDDKLQAMYKAELQLKKAAGIASGLMLLIVLLGIFGVMAIALTRRTKEIATRKVLGAGLHNILSLFIQQYAGLLLVANLVAWPLAWYFTNQWLQQYQYRISQSAGNYFVAGGIVTVISFVLISLQCLKVATINPVKSLKTE